MNDLATLGEAIKLMSPADLMTFRSFEEFLKEAEIKTYISGREYYRKDIWGSDLVWEVKQANKITIVRIGSKGPNRVWENGNGDDLYVQVEFTNQSNLTPHDR